MSRRMKIPRGSMPIEVFCVSSRQGVWEGDWEQLKGTPIGNLFSQVHRRDLEQAVRGFSSPLECALGLPPEGALRKLPVRTCRAQKTCKLHEPKKCLTTSKERPWCFELDGLSLSHEATMLAHEALLHWGQGAYVVVVTEEENA